MMIALAVLAILYPVSVLTALLLGVRIASPSPCNSTTPEDPEMSKVTDAFAQYVAYRDQKEAAAVAAEQANHQAEVDAAVDANEDAEAGAILLAIPTAEPAPEPAPEG